MKSLQIFGLGRLFNASLMSSQRGGGFSESRFQRRLGATEGVGQEANALPVAETRAQWLRRAAEVSRREEIDPRLRTAR